MKPICITSEPEDLEQGLFGQTFYYILQILPYLYKERIFPAWELRTLHYGEPPSQITVPGALELAYEPAPGPYQPISLTEMRRRHAHVVGNDWIELNRIWSKYFRIPQRVQNRADALSPTGRALGVHYRGTDKQTVTWDSNPITQVQYIDLILDFLAQRPEFDVVIAASDESSFATHLASRVGLPVIPLGEVEFHLATSSSVSRTEKTDRAMLDCLLLSRCNCLIETSSALPSFAKLLRPELEVYRCAASKLFGKLFTQMPYFPVAHIPVLPVTRPASIEILRATMQSDWTLSQETTKYQKQFVAEPRWPVNHSIFQLAERCSMDRLLAKLVSGYH